MPNFLRNLQRDFLFLSLNRKWGIYFNNFLRKCNHIRLCKAIKSKWLSGIPFCHLRLIWSIKMSYNRIFFTGQGSVNNFHGTINEITIRKYSVISVLISVKYRRDISRNGISLIERSNMGRQVETKVEPKYLSIRIIFCCQQRIPATFLFFVFIRCAISGVGLHGIAAIER